MRISKIVVVWFAVTVGSVSAEELSVNIDSFRFDKSTSPGSIVFFVNSFQNGCNGELRLVSEQNGFVSYFAELSKHRSSQTVTVDVVETDFGCEIQIPEG